ncbi:TIGR02680 family protein [Actinoalloteichus sp. AHMU CJ021]|uniref:TIGR02680 family protein n=1 Tax=Actinoalloteichus caeruleus DSM 43889 TaxID=1120930 RepID=A0ABT1JJQ1_ACTCY|nr:TIGR02680 family protein [Actinoalloteichus caeruleus]AUS77982.1 TIGR02680 family protein [Actinoalloteichus sp. AHMU CJ021]MCP2331961.1 TIGR02680 family protein [Actinoalloteichus caeruleus DSM 43889]
MSEPDRWRLNRGGIVNIWQYAEQTFDFSGGRAIFQGTNGSGKSRTLELLLPLCLDGDLRQLGSKGFDTVSMRRLMLDDYQGGPNRIGYAWVELVRRTPVGPEFLTCGLGVKASKAAQQITDSWRFITPRRVGFELRLVGADEVPLGPAQLRETLGADRVLDDAGFRARVADLVYQVPAARYADLLHLQRTLRNPDVGLKVLEGQLEQILSDALPPLDPAVIDNLATSFDDLESIRENIARLSTADDALGAFVTTYASYVRGALLGLGQRMTSADRALASLRSEIRRLTEQRNEADQECSLATARVASAEDRERELESAIATQMALPGYQGLRDLRDREALVTSAGRAAEAALEGAARQRAQEDRAVDAVLAATRRLTQNRDAAAELASAARTGLRHAGLDPEMCPRVPGLPSARVTVRQESVLAKPDPDAEPVVVERRLPPVVDAEELAAGFRSAAGGADEVAGAGRRRAALVSTLHRQAVALDQEASRVEHAARDARAAQVAATEAAGRRNEAEQRLVESAELWRERALSWFSESVPLSGARQPDAAVLELVEVEHLRAVRDGARSAAERARLWLTPSRQAASQSTVEAEHAVAEVRREVDRRDAELAALRSGEQRRPAGSPDPDTAPPGASFAELVDFRPEVAPPARAGVEAALASCGLLTAWVPVDARAADPVVRTLLATAWSDPAPEEPAADGRRTLAEVLVPAVDPNGPVPEELVRRLLSSVPLTDRAPTGPTPLSVSEDGRWWSGVLYGAGAKDTAEFVGAGARQAARTRRIGALEEELHELRGALAAAERTESEARAKVELLDRQLAAFPDYGELVAAHAALAGAAGAASDAEDRARRLREEHRRAEERWGAAETELRQRATEAGLPSDAAGLDAAHRHATEARDRVEQLRDVLVGRCVGAVDDLAEAGTHHQAAVADRAEAEELALRACRSYGEQRRSLTELTSSVGGEAENAARRMSDLERRRAEVREELPAAREAVMTARERLATLATLLETKQGQLGERETEADRASTAFTAALRSPGTWAAALTTTSRTRGDAPVGAPGTERAGAAPAEPPPDPRAALALVSELAESRPASETTVITRLQTLQVALAGTHDITAAENAGVLGITVSGEDGPRPVAVAARQVRDRLATQRGYLNERYQTVFADYLIRDLAERLRGQIAVAEDLCARMNAVLDRARSSQGVHVQLEWRPSPALDDATRQALDLVRTPLGERDSDQDALLRRVVTERIESERDAHARGYAEILTRALDYRGWHSFTVRVRDDGPDGRPRVRRLRQLSSGETRLVSYVALFAAAASFYDAVDVGEGDGAGAGGAGAPLRLVLLDEAFERLDDPTIARMLGLLVDLDMDWLITWPSGWGVSPKIPRMHIYDVLRPKSGAGVACTHTTWDGADLTQHDA